MKKVKKEFNLKEVLVFLRQYVRKGYGKQCGDFNINCASCQQWLMISLLQDLVDTDSFFKNDILKMKNKAKK